MIPMFPPKKAAYLDELDNFLGWAENNGIVVRDGSEYLKKQAAPAQTRQEAAPVRPEEPGIKEPGK